MCNDRLIKEAHQAMKQAYCPYSHFSVGAALLGKNGNIYTGCNVENISYGLTICAERGAVCKAVADGETEFSAIAIVTDTKKPVSPCGACRQVLAEFSTDMTVIMATAQGEKRIAVLKELLPLAFDSDWKEQELHE